MAFRVDFEDGRSVTFEKKPTQKDIEEAAAQMSATKKTFAQDAVEDVKETGSAIGQQFKDFAEKAKSARQFTQSGDQTVGEGIGQTAGALGSAIVGSVGEIAKGAGKVVLPQGGEDAVGRAAKATGEAIAGTAPAQFAGRKISEFKENNPRAARNIEGLLGLGEIATAGAGGLLARSAGKVAGQAAQQAGQSVSRGVKSELKAAGELANEIGQDIRDGFRFTPTRERIAQLVEPKNTITERQRAIREERAIQEGNNIFGTKVRVEPTAKIKKATDIIEKSYTPEQIADQFKLSDAIKADIAARSARMAPQLAKREIEGDEIAAIRERYDELKLLQQDDIEFQNFLPGATKAQEKFERFLSALEDQDGRKPNLDDLWKARIAYDDSIKSAIKNVDPGNPTTLPTNLLQFEMWIENRKLLNDALESLSEDMPLGVRNQFDEMTALYNARQNIISRADFKSKEGLLTPGTIIKNLLPFGLGSFFF